MELLFFLAVLAVLVLPILSLIFSLSARNKANEALVKMEGLQLEINSLRSKAIQLPAEKSIATAALIAPIIQAPPASPQLPQEEKTKAEQPPTPEPSLAAALSPPSPVASTIDPTPTVASSLPQAKSTIEERIGLVWLTRIGVIIGIISALWFFKYMINNDLIGPWGQVAVGFLTGLSLLVWGEWMVRKDKVHKIFSHGILALGLALLFVSCYASFSIFHLVPVTLAFSVVILLVVLGGVLAYSHKSEPMLVLSLIAALLSPVLLSTGVDRPLVLFSYWTLISCGALVVAAKLRFRFALWTTVAGTCLLFCGWYLRFFDVTPPPPPGAVDRLAEELQGAYFPLWTRWSALLFALVIAAQWVIAGLHLQKKDGPISALFLYLASAVASLGAACALLFDHPVLLGSALCALSACFAVLFIRIRKSDWLGVPMLTSFLILAGVSQGMETSRLLLLLAITGLMCAIYFVVFLRALRQTGTPPWTKTLLLLGGVGLGLALLGGIWLVPDRIEIFGALLNGLCVVYLIIFLMFRAVAMLCGALLLSLVGFLICGANAPENNMAMIALSGVWFLLYVGALAYDWLIKKSETDNLRLAVLGFAGAGFASLFLLLSAPDAQVLRALLSLGAGSVYLLLGLALSRVDETSRKASLLPLAVALSFFTLAVVFLFSGATVTVVWALEGALLCYLAARNPTVCQSSDRYATAWIGIALALFFLAVMRFFSMDLPWIELQQELFVDTQGAKGVLLPHAFMHPRAWSLLGLAFAFFVGARFLARRARDAFLRTSSLGLLLAGHAAMIGLLISEFRLLWGYPEASIARGLTGEEFSLAWQNFEAAVRQSGPRLDMITTLVLGVYAMLLLGIGFGQKSKVQRLVGLSLFGITLLKLGLWDIWALETIFKIIVGVGIAALMLSGAFLYGRFGNRIKSLLTKKDQTPPKILWMMLLAGALCGSRTSQGADFSRYQQRAELAGISDPGDYRLLVEPSLYPASLTDPLLADIRIAGPDGSEVPYAIQDIQLLRKAPDVIEARVLNPVILLDGSSQVLLEVKNQRRIYRAIDLGISGSEYLRKTQIESSLDGRTFGVLCQGALIFDIRGDGPQARRTWINLPDTAAPFLRVTILPGADGARLQVVSSRVIVDEESPPQPPRDKIPLGIARRTQLEKGRTAVELEDLPQQVPFDALLLEIEPGEFVRRVRLEASTHQQAWFPAGGGLIYRVIQKTKGSDLVDQSLSLDLDLEKRPHLRLVFEDGDDAPLGLLAVYGEYQKQEIWLRARLAGVHQLYIGLRHDSAPQYDLDQLIRRGGVIPSLAISMGVLQPNPDFRPVAIPAEPQAWTERNRVWLQWMIGIAVAGLLIWTLWLIRKTRKESSPQK